MARQIADRGAVVKETEMTTEEAREVLSQPGYDGYGALRVYGVIGSGECAGQILGIKSVQYLDRFEWSRVYSTCGLSVPVRRR